MKGGSYDVVVVGAGPNGLAAATLLARRGRRVLVLERRSLAGGIAARETFHPGYDAPGLLHETGSVRASVADALRLGEHGLAFRAGPLPIVVLGRDGRSLRLGPGDEETVGEIAARSPRDAEAWPRFRAFVDGVAPVVRSVLDEEPPDLGARGAGEILSLLGRAWKIRRLGRDDMMELMRVPTLPLADWLGEWFEDDLLRAGLAGPALEGLFAGPRSPGTAMNLLAAMATAGSGVHGGGPAFVRSLLASARAHAVEVRTETEVTRVVLEEGRVAGVETASGEMIGSRVVLAACDARHALLDLLPAGALAYESEHRVRSFRARGTTAKVHLALERPIEFAARRGERVARARTGETLEELERAFDPAKYRRLPERPVLDIFVPTVEEPEYAPPGGEVVSVLVSCVPHDLEGGWNDERRGQLGDHVVAMLEDVAPGVERSVVGREVLAPPDLAARYGMTNGHPHHGEHALDQLVLRPAPEFARYRTPVRGLYLGASGSHPGGGLTGVPGTLAAAALLRETGSP